MCWLLYTKILTFDTWVRNKFKFFVLKRVKCIYKDDIPYDNQLIITLFRFVDSTLRSM